MGLFSKDIQSMDDLFVHGLQDIYYAENQILKSLPDMIEKAANGELKKGLQTHLGETRKQVHRLEQVFRMHGKEPQGASCPAIDGILEEADDIIGEVEDKNVLDAAMIAAAQARRLRRRAAAESRRGESHRQETHRDGGKARQPGRGERNQDGCRQGAQARAIQGFRLGRAIAPLRAGSSRQEAEARVREAQARVREAEARVRSEIALEARTGGCLLGSRHAASPICGARTESTERLP